MKRVVSWMIVLCLLLAGCGPADTPTGPSSASTPGGQDGLTVSEMFPDRSSTDAEEPDDPPEDEPEEPDKQTVTVYVTKTGEKYHVSGCQYLSKSKIAIDLDDAIAEGYTACSKCGPPRP